MGMKRIFLLVVIVAGVRLSLAQSNARVGSACRVAGHTTSGQLAVVCQLASSGTCYRFSGSRKMRGFRDGIPVWLDFEATGIRISDNTGRSIGKLKVAKWIILNSRQWLWFGPVSDIACVAGQD